MADLLFALMLAGGFSFLLAACYLVFCSFLFVVYRLDGGKMNYFRYMSKM